MALIELQNIRKSFPDGENKLNNVLRNVDLSIKKGEFVAIKGASGAGKSTLLNILGTLLTPDNGSYLLNGTEMTAPSTNYSQIRNKEIGFVFQDHRLMPQFTALENILLPTLAYRAEASQAEIDYARQLMEITNISSVANQYPHTLSGGEASRVAVCRALIMKPLLVLADEPTGQLDAENAQNIAKLLDEINNKLNTTIIMVTHSDETSAVAHRILMLKNGILE
ncbi:MAG: ABC transporter ATP-binding protein [Dysgonamonadaceae bacterium]|jgi:ABC-type lipoprotein export system ATPase subunit|nr:ABC transporter ATP-binding protein [Dysgonamonadaceae bacterium]